MGASRQISPSCGFCIARFGWSKEVRTGFWIHLVLLVFSGLLAGGPASGTAIAGDLNVVFEKDVAAVTPDMVVLPQGQGSVSANDSHNLQYHTDGLAKLKKQGMNIWAEEASAIGDVPTISENQVLHAGFILSAEVSVGTITNILAENRLVATEGMVVYLDIGTESGLTPGDRFIVFSKKRFIRHPVKQGTEREWFPWFTSSRYRAMGDEDEPVIAFENQGKKLGDLVRILGILDVLDVEVGKSKAIVQKIFDDIRQGDFIMPYQKPVLAKRAPSSGKSIEGYVVAFKEETMGAMTNDIIYLDVGTEQGVRPGDVFQIYVIPQKDNETKWFEYNKPKTTPLSPLVIGELQVVATRAGTSSAVILDVVQDLKGPGQFVRYKP